MDNGVYLDVIFPLQHQVQQHLRDVQGGIRPDVRLPEPPKLIDCHRMNDFDRIRATSGIRPDVRLPEPPKLIDYHRMNDFDRMRATSGSLLDRK